MTMLHAFFALSLLFPQPAAAKPTYQHDINTILRVECHWADGGSVGTAVKVGPSTYITAAHVVDNGECFIGAIPATVAWSGGDDLDFAVLIGPQSPGFMPISCKGFKLGEVYLARGYAFGGYEAFMLPWLATKILWQDGLEMFAGDAHPGMSGGPLIDRPGRVTGIVVTRNPSMSLALSKTPVCP